MRWDLFCTVVDNFGDIGFCWRLARQLSNEYPLSVRLWVDDLTRLAWLWPGISIEAERQYADKIEVRRWSSDFQFDEVADVVIEAFACNLPASYVEAMQVLEKPPVWINLEYLSAEDWIEGCHLLASPMSRSSLTKTFFFPGFTTKTGGLLREKQLLNDRAEFFQSSASQFWRQRGSTDLADACEFRNSENGSSNHRELLISLFCYENAALPLLLSCWSESSVPIRLLTTVGHATSQVADWFGEQFAPGKTLHRGTLTVHAVPFLSQSDYDRLLWSCDVNFVRGEDSFVRAQWAQRPFVWQIYPQSENVHLVKLDAFLSRYLLQFDSGEVVRRFWQAWNGVGKIDIAWKDFAPNLPMLEQHGKVWATELDQAGNLADNLVRFVRGC